MPYEKMPYKKFNGKGRLTLNPSSLTLNRKRGKLAPLMSEDAKATTSIHELSYDFACRITRLFQYLTGKLSILLSPLRDSDRWLTYCA